MEERSELLRHYRESRSDLLAAIAGLSEARMTEPTLEGWSVKDHLSHLVLWDELRAAEVERISAGFGSAWRMSEEQVAAYNQLGHELRGGLSTDQAMWELQRSRERLLQAIAEATEDGMDGSRYGEAGLRSTHEAEHAGWIREWRRRRGISGGGWFRLLRPRSACGLPRRPGCGRSVSRRTGAGRRGARRRRGFRGGGGMSCRSRPSWALPAQWPPGWIRQQP